jgi:predicted GTPase
VYPFEYKDVKGTRVKINVIDTPGLGDTRGPAFDDSHIDDIIDTIRKQPALNALVFVMNGSVERIDPVLKSVFIRLQGAVPDKMTDNLLAVLTNCNRATRYVRLATCMHWSCQGSPRLISGGVWAVVMHLPWVSI